jgi:transposase
MEVILERAAALDVHNASVMACVRVPGEGRRRVEHVAEFQTTVQGLLALRDWLEAHDVEKVAMEATGVYWKPVWAVLEDRFDCLLVNARHVKQVPGRKTDVRDAQWLCQLLEAGLLKPSLVPPKPVRTLRNLTRYRKCQIRDRQREMNRLHKVMQDTGIKLDCVATDMLGKSGRAMLDALVSGTTDPVVLADLARGQLRKKLPALRAALEGRFDVEHSLVVGRILAHIDYLDEAIDDLSAAIEQQLGPFAPAVELLCTIPGVGRRAAEVIIAETGGDMSAFPSAKHLASWAGHVPGQRRVGRQAPLGQDAQGLQVAQPGAGRMRQDGQPQQGHLPRRTIRAPARPPRRQQGHDRRLSLDPDRRLAHAPDRRDLHRPGRRLLRPPRPRAHPQTPRRTARTPRLHRHPAGRRRGSLSQIFSTGAVLAHRLARRLTTEMDESQQRRGKQQATRRPVSR